MRSQDCQDEKFRMRLYHEACWHEPKVKLKEDAREYELVLSENKVCTKRTDTGELVPLGSHASDRTWDPVWDPEIHIKNVRPSDRTTTMNRYDVPARYE